MEINMNRCRICDNDKNNTAVRAVEKLYGTGEEFDYFRCGNCGCIQIREIPGDLSKYYPDDYYSKSKPGVSTFKAYLKRSWYRRLQGRFNIPGWLLGLFIESPDFIKITERTGLNLDDRVLDVGSGNGHLLYEMYLAGYRNLTGADPFIPASFNFNNNIRILKRELHEIEGKYDFIMLNYSFEHMPGQKDVMITLAGLMTDEAKLVIRIPMSDSAAYEKYVVNWVQFDAPRHLYLHTAESMKILAHETGFKINEVIRDSNEFQFWGSILFENNIPLTATKLHSRNPMRDFRSLVSKADMKLFRETANQWNREGRGDQATFILEKS